MVFLSLFFLSIPLLLFLTRNWWTNNRNVPPGPQGLPVLGNLHQLDKSLPLHHQLWQFSKKYGPLVYLQLGFVPTIVVSSAKMAKEVLKTHDAAFSGRPTFVGLQRISYYGQEIGLSPYNEYTKELKKICATQLFSQKSVQSFRAVREEEVVEMIKKIHELASDSKLVNLSEMVMSLTSTVVCRMAFGKTYSNNLFTRSKLFDLLQEGQAAYGGFYISDYIPYTGWIDILTGKIARRDKTFKELDAFIEKIVYEHMDDERDKSGQNDIVDVLLQIQKDNSSRIKLTMDGIKGVVLLDIFTAGTDSTASSLVWSMTELLKNPKRMTILQKEIRESNPNKQFLNEDSIQNTPYLRAVLKETMRLHPVAPLLLPHQATEECNLNGYIIRPKTSIYVNAYAIGRDPESWENPEEFLPERFLGSSIDFRGQDFELIPFGSGRRGCPGMLMAIAMVELALANIVYAFDWDLPSGMREEDIDMDVKPGVAVHKKVPLCLLPRKHGDYGI